MRVLTGALVLGALLIGGPALGQQNASHEMMDGMEKMQNDMAATPMTGDPDADFVAMMMPHHQGAIDMAKVELKYGKDPAMRQLANEIVAAQDKEIAMMRGWQSAHPAR